MKSHWQISAGEFFDLMRPLALVISALISTWVLASARRWRFHFVAAIAWAIGTFLFPFIVLPIYLIARGWTRRSTGAPNPAGIAPAKSGSSPTVSFRVLLPALYALLLLTLIGLYIYRDYRTVDAHLARAQQAKVMNQQARAIREYRAALTIEDNPHTHKLLGIELAEMKEWPDALREFRAAEGGGEPDDLLPFHVGEALDATGRPAEAAPYYNRFLKGQACVQQLPDNRCEIARQRLGSEF